MDSHRLTNHPADSSRRRMGYKVPEASWQPCSTSAPENSSVGFSRNASNTFNVWRDIRTSRSCLPIVVTLPRYETQRKPRALRVLQTQLSRGSREVWAGIEPDGLTSKVGNFLGQHPVAATHIQDVFSTLGREQFQYRHAKVR